MTMKFKSKEELLRHLEKEAEALAYKRCKEKGYKDSFAEGFVEGFIEGYIEGYMKEVFRIPKILKSHEYDNKFIADITGFPLDMIEEL